jgi:hypothetical protein
MNKLARLHEDISHHLKLARLHQAISDHLEAISDFFTQKPKITIVIRTPWLECGDVVLTDDDSELAIAAIKRLEQAKDTIVINERAAPTPIKDRP